MHTYTKDLLTHCEEYAKDLLNETLDFYPFGAFTSKVEQVHPIEMDPENKNSIKNGQVVESLLTYLTGEFDKKEVLAYATVYEVQFQLSEGEEASTAFAVDIVNSQSEEPIFYYPYQVNGTAVTFDEPFAVKR